MIFELVLLAGSCHGQACRLERPLIERRVQKTTVVKVEKSVVKERKLTIRRFVRVSR